MAKHYFAAMTRNKTSLAGTGLVIGSLTLMLSLIAIQMIGLRGGAYIGIITFVLLPMVLVAGLVLIYIGIRRQRKLGESIGMKDAGAFPIVDLNQERTRKAILGVVGIGTVSAVVLAAATYKGVEVMDSTPFCGTVCHTVMQPEFTAHQRSAACPRSLRRLPHRPGRGLVRQGQDFGRLAAGRRRPSISIRRRSRHPSTTCARRAIPASNVTGRRPTSVTCSR